MTVLEVLAHLDESERSSDVFSLNMYLYLKFNHISVIVNVCWNTMSQYDWVQTAPVKFLLKWCKPFVNLIICQWMIEADILIKEAVIQLNNDSCSLLNLCLILNNVKFFKNWSNQSFFSCLCIICDASASWFQVTLTHY